MMLGSTVKTVAIVQARMTSTRLPGKVMLPLAGEPMLMHVIRRVQAIPGVDEVVIATPPGSQQLPIHDLAKALPGVIVVTGPETDVLERTIAAATLTGAATVIRVTSDCPMIDPKVSGAVLAAFFVARVAYARTRIAHGYPHGFDTEVVSIEALRAAAAEATDPYEREHVTPFIWRRPDRFSTLLVDTVPDRRHWRLVVDTVDDYRLAREVFDELYTRDPLFGLDLICDLFAARPELVTLNTNVPGTPYVGIPPDTLG